MSQSDAVARGLLDLRKGAERIAPAAWPGPKLESIEDGYAAQAALTSILKGDRGQRQIGFKIGATNQMARELLGVSEPFFGRLYAEQTLPNGSDVPGDVIYVVAEPEIAVELGRDLTPEDGPFDAEAIRAATSALIPAFEIIASGFDPWTGAGGPMIVADNGAHGLWVPGAPVSDWTGFDPLEGEIKVSLGGQAPMVGKGAAVEGGPFVATAWLANALAARGETLTAGARISTGTVTPPIALTPGLTIDADYGALGMVSVSFAKG